MAHPIERSRNHCAAIGAIRTVQAIGGVIPIIHSTAGCGMQQYLGENKAGVFSSAGYVVGGALPSSNVVEKQIVFGGSSRLREQIKNTVKIVEADLYPVLSGCSTELVGDDILAMVKEAREQGFPVIHIATPGFKGDIHAGYELAVKGIFEQLHGLTVVPNHHITGLVNIFGVVPGQDVFWQGHLAELQNILTQIGLSANTLFGFEQGIEAWQKVPQAELNLVFSPWGIEIAEYLQKKFETPYLKVDGLPVGFDATHQLLQIITKQLNLDVKKLKCLQAREQRRLAFYLEKIADIYFAQGLQKEFALVGETSLVVGLTSFLTNSLGFIPKVLVITDNPSEPYRISIGEKMERLYSPFDTKVVFYEDQGRINETIRQSNVELVLGSSLEQEIAEELHIPFLPVSFPIMGLTILNKSYIGFHGAISFLEDLTAQILLRTG